MQAWLPYADLIGEREHTVVGDLLVCAGVHSPQLGNRRDLFVLLPPSYHQSRRRYPVIYMHDGQNLFDAAASFSGEWLVDETMQMLAGEGREALVVGVANAGSERIAEYSPFTDARLADGGRGDAYLAFLAETVKPLIDSHFRSLPDREHTTMIGSSMGGLISLYAFFARPDLVGHVAAMSPSAWFGEEALYHDLLQRHYRPGRIYLDVGTREGLGPAFAFGAADAFARRYTAGVFRLYQHLLEIGYRPGHDIRYVEEADADHSEAAWARRLPATLRFLLDPIVS